MSIGIDIMGSKIFKEIYFGNDVMDSKIRTQILTWLVVVLFYMYGKIRNAVHHLQFIQAGHTRQTGSPFKHTRASVHIAGRYERGVGVTTWQRR